MNDIALTSTPGCQITRTGLVIAEDASEAELIEVGRQLAAAEGALQWWVGDLAVAMGKRYGESYVALMEATGLDYDTCRKAKVVAKKIELFRRRHNLSWSHHAEIAGMDDTEADQWLDRAEKKSWTRADLRRELKAAKRSTLPSYQAALLDASSIPEGPFQVIYADPPWKYEQRHLDNDRSPSAHYPVMPTEEIAALPVAGRADATGSVLYLWAISPCLPQALEVMRAWGFSYKSQIIWDKERISLGFWVRNRHELLLIGTGSTLPPPNPADRVASIQSIKAGRHSEKPAEFARIIEKYHPNTRKLELFARGPARVGWEAWGNEAEITNE